MGESGRFLLLFLNGVTATLFQELL